jgi:hypothetical protein
MAIVEETIKAVDFSGLHKAHVSDESTLVYTFGDNADFDADSFRAMLDAIATRIAAGKKPAGVLAKAVNAVSFHVEQLERNVTVLLETYDRMISTEPRKRTGSATKARKAMLDGVSDKTLKLFAGDYDVDTDDYILPDDRAVLITAILDAMAEKEQTVVAASAE